MTAQPEAPGKPPLLSVVIPTRDRPAMLAACLESLHNQSAPAGSLEIVVVDDGSDPALALGDLRAGGGPFAVRMIVQEPSGANAARNRGAVEARAPVLAFVDDDELVHAGWAAAVLETFAGDCVAMAGCIALQPEGPLPRWARNPKTRTTLGELDLGPTPMELPASLSPFSGNCAIRTAAFAALGGFPTHQPPPGVPSLNDEIALFRAARRLGPVVYQPAAAVLHRVPATRLSTAWVRQRYRAQGVCDVLFLEGGGRGAPRALREVVRTGRVLPILLRNLAAGAGVANAGFWLSYCAGRRQALRSS
jgi:GT2 family glycosyltransferase